MDLQRPDSYQGGAGPHFSEHVLHKTILVGDSGVGKTSLLVQFDQGKFIPGSFSATVGIGFTNKVVTVDGVRVKLQIWDTAGQERFRSVTHAYYRDAQALLLLYDITSRSSFDNIRAWLTEIHEYAQRDVVIMLLGNKADVSSERVIRSEDGETLARGAEIPGRAAGQRAQLPDPGLCGIPEETAQLLLLRVNPEGWEEAPQAPEDTAISPSPQAPWLRPGEKTEGPRTHSFPGGSSTPRPYSSDCSFPASWGEGKIFIFHFHDNLMQKRKGPQKTKVGTGTRSPSSTRTS
ncbi:ras-related protein Rab-37 isoform X1 [Dasypus novemcinctus]|uniref:ras-related protein Rab-37 isoform X1 n=1 Tax=Dasypus novemcinctus TaxID=9361 RepID=UPI000328FA16|nr:ras-related protein Rab-37 isoform X1 [Dasypus novemcinctus]